MGTVSANRTDGQRTEVAPAWARLLEQHRKEGHFGMTLPFLVGAIRRPVGAIVAEAVSVREFQSLLESMRDQPVNSSVHIFNCAQFQQPTAALCDHSPDSEAPIAACGGDAPHLFVAERYLTGGPPNIETALRNLWNIVQKPINEGRFSYPSIEEDCPSEFRSFNTKDRAFIRRALR
jgi:hypothetical protein